MHLFEGLPAEWTRPGMEVALKQIATPFGEITLSLKVDNSGKSAMLHVEKLADKACENIVVHLKGWSTGDKDQTITLDPSKSHELKIDILR